MINYKNKLLLSITILMFVGCNKQKKDKCVMELYKIDYHVSFVGFTADELDTIYVSKYLPGSNFDTLKSIDTLMGLSISFVNDTSNTLFTEGYYDCKIGFASSKVEFYLKDPVYPLPMKYEAYGCGRYSVRPPYSITVNDHSQSINELSINWGYLFLKKY